VGDCDGSGDGTVNELITMVNIALGNAGTCPHGIPSDAEVNVALIIQAVNNALNGCAATPTPTRVPNSCAGQPDGTTCDAGTDSAHTSICVSGTCGQCTVFTGSPRFVDNGDGTITDRQTCLVWEKKDDAGGLHDKDNLYLWSSSGTAQDGGAFTVFLAGLNTAAFAGHHDWRLPSEDGLNPPFTGPKELESILASPCGGGPCVGAAFNTNCGTNSSGNTGCTVDGVGSMQCSCTQSAYYWSATTNAGFPRGAWSVGFSGGYVLGNLKTNDTYVRAVRGGL
jgi:hypothetical protein